MDLGLTYMYNIMLIKINIVYYKKYYLDITLLTTNIAGDAFDVPAEGFDVHVPGDEVPTESFDAALDALGEGFGVLLDVSGEGFGVFFCIRKRDIS